MILRNRRMTANEYTEKLRGAGLRASAQRIAVLEFMDGSYSHPTAEEIYRALLPTYPTLSLTTVYNTVHTLVESGLLREVEIDAANLRFDTASRPAHGHFRCRRCGRIFDMPLTDGAFDKTVPAGFEVDTIDVYFKGVCCDCKNKDN